MHRLRKYVNNISGTHRRRFLAACTLFSILNSSALATQRRRAVCFTCRSALDVSFTRSDSSPCTEPSGGTEASIVYIKLVDERQSAAAPATLSRKSEIIMEKRFFYFLLLNYRSRSSQSRALALGGTQKRNAARLMHPDGYDSKARNDRSRMGTYIERKICK